MNRKLIISIVLVTGLLLWLPKVHSVRASTAALRQTEQQASQLRSHIMEVTSALKTARAKLAAQEQTRVKLVATIAGTERELEKANPESRWALPPTTWPEWNAQSPYVWVTKDVVPQIPVAAFDKDGTLVPGAAMILALSDADRRSLDAKLAKILSDYRELEIKAAKVVTNHLSNIAWADGDKITIQIKSIRQQALQAMQDYQATLRADLGAQRGDLVIQQSISWFVENFSDSEDDPKTISLARRPDGSFSIATSSKGSSMSTGFPKDQPERIETYVPPHLMRFFEPLLLPSDSTADPK